MTAVKEELNEELMVDVIKFLEENPKAWEQGEWVNLGKDAKQISTLKGLVDCGTTGCVAGWAVLMKDPKWVKENPYGDVQYKAENLLGLTPDQAYDIFYYCTPGEDVPDEDWNKLTEEEQEALSRPVTIDEMKAKITKVTGIEFL